MFASLRAGWRNWQAKGRFAALDADWRELVVYSEDAGSWPHLGPIVRELTQRGQRVTFVTSSEREPLLQGPVEGVDPALVQAICVGEGAARTAWFMALDCKVLLMTMPDLETLHIKRSRAATVHYVYVFHSMVSTHMIYRPDAFDHVDTVFCVGPQHRREIRARETAAKLPAKRLISHGYARLETIRAEIGAQTRAIRAADAPLHVLVAPSWGPTGLLELHADALVGTLLAAGFRVTLRPHPMTSRSHARLIADVMARHGCDRLELDQDMRSRASLLASDVMISDWSGAALEYAFGLERPVLFVDVPRKVRNDGYATLGIEPLEVAIRSEVGAVVAADALETIPAQVRALCADPSAFATRIAAARERTVDNLGSSAVVAADELLRLCRGDLSGPGGIAPNELA